MARIIPLVQKKCEFGDCTRNATKQIRSDKNESCGLYCASHAGKALRVWQRREDQRAKAESEAIL